MGLLREPVSETGGAGKGFGPGSMFGTGPSLSGEPAG